MRNELKRREFIKAAGAAALATTARTATAANVTSPKPESSPGQAPAGAFELPKERTPKLSAMWFKEAATRNAVV